MHLVHAGHASQVWQACHDGEGRNYAIKLLPENDLKSQSHRRYLKREWEVGRQVIHPQIVKVVVFAEERGIPYLAMEWFPAPSMKSRIRQGLEAIAPQIAGIVLKATESLHFLHSKGWIHRDVKPENFLVADDGDLKLIDFSLAQRKLGFFGRIFRLRVRAKVQGTRSYISPEQILGRPLDERSDLYSLACTLYELITGKPPFTGTTSSELLSRHLRATPPPLESINSNVTPEFSQLIRRTLAKEPEARPRSTYDFYKELRSVAVFRRPPVPAGKP